MQRCDSSQVELSSLLDGQVDVTALADALDHAMSCEDCRRSYAAFRELDRELAGLPEQDTPRRSFPLAHMRSLALAACVLLSLSWAWLSSPEAPDEVARAVEVQLGAHPERMDEARFVELAVELLQADPRYANSMQRLLRQVQESRASFFESGLAEPGSAFEAENASITRLYH